MSRFCFPTLHVPRLCVPHIPHAWEKKLQRSHNLLHMVYFGMVAVESGHWYGAAAAILLFVSLADHLPVADVD